MTDAPKSVEPMTSIPAGDLHPNTPVVTAALHNQIVAGAQAIVDKLLADALRHPFDLAVFLVLGIGLGVFAALVF